METPSQRLQPNHAVGGGLPRERRAAFTPLHFPHRPALSHKGDFFAAKRHECRAPFACVMLLVAIALCATNLRAGVYPNTPTRLWPNGIIPVEYDNDPSINLNQVAVVVQAMNAWMAAANVSFVSRNNEPDYLFIRQGTNGPSYPVAAGYQAGQGKHTLNLNFWGNDNDDYLNCKLVFGMAHEVGHALGLSHTHQSTNRNLFFNVRTNLVTPGNVGNYNIDSNSRVWPRNLADIDSIMSYPLCTFSICTNCSTNLQNCAPILLQEPYATDWATNLTCPSGQCPPPLQCVGQRNHLSVWDKAVMSYLYPQSNWRFAEAGSVEATQTGKFHYPAKTFTNGVTLTPAAGTLYLEPATYGNSGGVHTKHVTLRATRVGSAVIRQ
ncbi:MAG: hypothetical protein EXS35_12550 [Pedosphaera sp.]|nr:hypothetical protein [Pedosphaera sp.]